MKKSNPVTAARIISQLKSGFSGESTYLDRVIWRYRMGWYDSIRISSIGIEPSFTSTKKNVKITITPPTWPIADPGEYVTNFKAENEDVVGEIDLTAKIIARYQLNAAPANQRYNTKAKAGRDNIFSIVVTNTGSATIENITFSSEKPEGWEITNQPDKIDLLEIIDPKSIDVNIKPPPKTVAGDYMITLWYPESRLLPVK